jgi:hypothetical protein
MLRLQYVSAKESPFALFETLEVKHHGLGVTLLCAATYN